MSGARECIARLLNLGETLVAETHQLRAENQRLRDEVSRLKGQQGETEHSPQSTPRQARVRRRNGGSRKIGTKAARSNKSTSTGKRSWKWTRRLCRQMRSSKGTEKAVAQDLRISSDNVEFLKANIRGNSANVFSAGAARMGRRLRFQH